MYGLIERELEGRAAQPPFLDRLASGGPEQLSVPDATPDVRGYLARALRGGFPEVALAGRERARQRWLSSYRDPMRLRRYLRALAASTAGVPTMKTLIDAAGIDRATAMSYDTMLESLFLTEQLPAWSANRLNRLIRLPKRYLIDPAFVGPLLGVDARAAMRDGDLLGRILDSFVVAQLRADCVVSKLSPRLFHIRDTNGRHEVDVLAEFANGRVAGFEVKADAAPGPEDARHLRWLKNALGERFAAGIVLHTGPHAFRLEDEIFALPICVLWG